MSSVNKTENYGLSQFSANDQPTWMGDYSGDMQKIDTALGNSVKRTSDKFSESLPYAAGAYCIKDDLLYKFKSAKSAGAWDASKVQATTVMSEITGLTENMDHGKIVVHNGEAKITFNNNKFKKIPSVVASLIGKSDTITMCIKISDVSLTGANVIITRIKDDGSSGKIDFDHEIYWIALG